MQTVIVSSEVLFVVLFVEIPEAIYETVEESRESPSTEGDIFKLNARPPIHKIGDL